MPSSARAAPVVLLLAACATVNRPDLETLKPTAEAFHQRVRFKDFRGASELIVPERRDGFVRARDSANDEKDLFFTDYELEEAKVSPDLREASIVSKLSWYRLPSTTEQRATLTSRFAWRQGRWLLESQEAGPFPELLPAPDAGTPPNTVTNADAGT